MENLRKIINFRWVNNAKVYEKYISKPSSVSRKIFSKHFATIHEIKPVLSLDKLIYVGFSILELSKLFMYDFHYNYIKRKYNAKLLFTSTDSSVYEIKADDVYEDFYKGKHLFDLSSYPKDLKFFDPVNKKVISKMKDESTGKINDEFVGLKSKIQSIKDVDGKVNKTVKRVNTNVVKNIEHETYIDVLFNKKVARDNMKRTQSNLHRIRTYNIS